MPFYEYECRSCRYSLEAMQKITDAPLTKCPSCGKRTLVKLISAPVFRLKGSGWYETDFKSDKEGRRNLAGAEREESKPAEETKSAEVAKPAEAAKSETPSAAKATESKPEAKASPAEASAGGKRRAAPAARRSAASGARAGVRARGKSAPAKGAARGRSKR